MIDVGQSVPVTRIEHDWLTRFLSALLALVVLTACTPPSEPAPPENREPVQAPRFQNLVVVMIDTLRADHLPSYGYERNTAPFLARLADEGVQFDGYSATSWTRPSVATLLTGVSPQRHQVITRIDFLSPELPYLPALLADRGFSTAAYIGNLNASRKWGFGRGFEHYRQIRPSKKKDDATRVNRAARQLIEEVGPPFFLYLHYVDPHDPYQPELAWGESAEQPVDRYQPRRLSVAEQTSPEILDRMRDQYDGEILELDRALEELLEMLDQRHLLDSTLVVVTSDHGEEFGEHGQLTHGRSLYEEVLHVPLLFWAEEGLPRGARPGRFHQVDFLSTVLEALDIAPPPNLGGTSRWPDVYAGASPEDATEYFFHLDLDGHGQLGLLETTGHQKRKLILEIDPATQKWFAYEFDLAGDPDEGAPLRPTASLIDRLVSQHNHEGELAVARVEEPLDPVRDASVRAQLEALGYIEADIEEGELRLRLLPEFLEPSFVEAAQPPP